MSKNLGAAISRGGRGQPASRFRRRRASHRVRHRPQEAAAPPGTADKRRLNRRRGRFIAVCVFSPPRAHSSGTDLESRFHGQLAARGAKRSPLPGPWNKVLRGSEPASAHARRVLRGIDAVNRHRKKLRPGIRSALETAGARRPDQARSSRRFRQQFFDIVYQATWGMPGPDLRRQIEQALEDGGLPGVWPVRDSHRQLSKRATW